MKIDYSKLNFTDEEQKKIREEVYMLKQKYAEHIPILIRTHQKLEVEKSKYLIPTNFTIGQALAIIRKKIKINSSDAIFCMINNLMIPSSNLIGQVYSEYKDPSIDMLVMTITKESVFG